MSTNKKQETWLLWVLGCPLHVVLVPDLKLDGDKCHGLWDDDHATIEISTDCCDRALTLFHEAGHAASDLLHLPKDWQNDEETRNSVFSVLVTGIMRDPRNRRVLQAME